MVYWLPQIQSSSAIDLVQKVTTLVKMSSFFNNCTFTPFIKNDTLNIWRELNNALNGMEIPWLIPHINVSSNHDDKRYRIGHADLIEVQPFLADKTFDYGTSCKVAVLLDNDPGDSFLVARRNFDMQIQFRPLDDIDEPPLTPIIKGLYSVYKS